MMGPLVPSATGRRYQHVSGRRFAIFSTVGGWLSLGVTTRVVRAFPRYRDEWVSITGPSRQPRVSAGIPTRYVPPQQASTAARTSALLPSRQSATTSLNGSTPFWKSARTIAPANWGLVWKARFSGTWHVVRRFAY